MRIYRPPTSPPPEVAADAPSRQAALAGLARGGPVGGGAGRRLRRRQPPVRPGPAGQPGSPAVDRQRDMLDAFAAAAPGPLGGLHRHRARRLAPGGRPAPAGPDVVVCHHVLHNVVDLPPFVEALARAARRVEWSSRCSPSTRWPGWIRCGNASTACRRSARQPLRTPRPCSRELGLSTRRWGQLGRDLARPPGPGLGSPAGCACPRPRGSRRGLAGGPGEAVLTRLPHRSHLLTWRG